MAADPTRVSLSELAPTVSKASEQYGVPEEYIWNVIRAENSGSSRGAAALNEVSTQAISPKNARGIMQVTPVALQDVQNAGLVPSSLSHDNLSLDDQIGVGTAYLSRLMKLSQDPKEIYAMYNYGPKARFRMADLPQETQGYLEKTGTTEKSGGGKTGTFGQGMLNSGDLISFLLSSGQQQNNAMTQANQGMVADQSRATELGSQAIEEQAAVIANAATNAAAKANVTYKQNKTLEQLQEMFNLNPEAANNEIATNLAVINSAQAAYAPARAEYDALASKSILDDPLGYLLAQVQMPSVAAKVNAIADKEDIANQRIQTRTAQLANAKATISANTADQIKSIQEQDAKNTMAESSARLLDAQAKNAVQSATYKMQGITVANMIGDNTRQTLQAVISLEDRAESAELRNEQRRQIFEGKRLKDEEEARLNARLAIVSQAKGMSEPMTMKRLTTLTDKKSQEEWLAAAQSGAFGESLEGSLRFYLGNGSSKVAIQSGGGASTWTTAEKLARQGAEYASLADRAHQKQTPGAKPLPIAEARTQGYDIYKNELIDSAMKPTEQVDLASSKWDRAYNPYVGQFVGFNKAIDSMPQMAGFKNNVLKTSIDTLLKTGAVTSENLSADQQQQAIKSVIARVTAREIEPRKAAADISQYIAGISAYQRSLNKYDLFSLPPANSYFFTIEGDFGGDNRRKTNLMDPVTLERDIIWQIKQAKSPTGYNGPFGFN